MIAVLLIAVGLSGCEQNIPVSEKKINFNVTEVTATSNLEVHDPWTNETKIERSNDTKFVIISIIIENDEDKILSVSTPILDGGLIDDEENTYAGIGYITINGSSYSVKDITSIGDEETFGDLGFIIDIPPNSTELKKIVFEIPIDREPKKLKMDYGFRANEQTLVKDWSDWPEIDLSSYV